MMTLASRLLSMTTPVAGYAGANPQAARSPLPAGSFLLGALAFLVAAGCLITALKVYTAIRGGRLGRSWVWIVLGFSAMGAAQFLLFVGQVGILSIWWTWVDALRLVSLTLILVGVTGIRKLLA